MFLVSSETVTRAPNSLFGFCILPGDRVFQKLNSVLQTRLDFRFSLQFLAMLSFLLCSSCSFTQSSLFITTDSELWASTLVEKQPQLQLKGKLALQECSNCEQQLPE